MEGRRTVGFSGPREVWRWPMTGGAGHADGTPLCIGERRVGHAQGARAVDFDRMGSRVFGDGGTELAPRIREAAITGHAGGEKKQDWE